MGKGGVCGGKRGLQNLAGFFDKGPNSRGHMELLWK